MKRSIGTEWHYKVPLGREGMLPSDPADPAAGERENFDFVQVSRSYLKDWRQLTKKNPLASEILMYFIEHMAKTTNAVVCSYDTLCDITGVSRRTVARAISVLKADSWIDAVKIGNATAYAINARAFWQTSRNMKKYAIFQATVIAGESEQDKEYLENAKKPIRHIPIIGDIGRVVHNGEKLPPPDQQDLDLD